MSVKKLLIILTILTISLFNAKAQTTIDDTYFNTNLPTYIWDLGGSPYLIMKDIKIPIGSDLIIEPGVEVLFQGHYKMDVKGSINAIGNSMDRIVFTSHLGEPWNGIRFDFSDGIPLSHSKLHYCDISNARKTGTICTIPDPESSGGAIFVKSFSDLEIYECEIFNNSVMAQGGAIGIYSNSSPKIWKSNIHNNTAVKRGGALCMMIDCDPIIANNTFAENESTSKGGGAIGVGDLSTGLSCSPTIIGNKIRNNSATKSGGGIFICNSDIVNFSENTFEENTTQASGGGVSIHRNSTVNMESNQFFNNIASVNGGAIYIGMPPYPDVTMNICQFSANSAVNGGAIYVDQAETDIKYSTFNNNTASTDGAGIYAYISTSIIEKCSFEDNTATGNGGGVYLNDPKGTITTIPKVKLNSFKSNTAYQGSALYCLRGANSGNGNEILNNLFAENHATDKGVVYMQGDNQNTIFNHNTVTNNYTPPAFISGVCYEDDNYFSTEFKNNIIFESIIDILIMSGQYQYQHPSNYATLQTLNSLQTNPNFVSSSDYHLLSSSNCINAGNNSATMTTTDLDDNQRINNTITDYGCYEYGSSPPARKGRTTSPNEDHQISVFPNPATDFLIVNTSFEQNIDISIYSLSGQRVYLSENNSIIGEEKISLSDFKPGVYIIKLQTINSSITKRIIIQ
ncbi:MAG: T9SS type A sorting domain-containing protein [Bacteroidales bacterium]|nr:T9SS type A sorting domain-containing protein [Bacteroidales bacterium]